MKIGIDLGTSYSSVAAEVNGKIEMIRVATGAGAFGDSFSIPTAAYVDNGRILLGQAAMSKRKLSPSCFKGEFKRDLGTTTPFILGEEEYLPEQLYTEFFLYFKNQAIEQTGEKIEKVYITHPANYGNSKKRLVEKAANNAGLLDVVLVDEPTAAAAGYSQKSRINEGDIVLVYDLGGGTFDVAIIKKTSKGYVHLTEPLGISMCGGVDFDRAIYDDIMQKLSKRGQFDMDRLVREKRFTAALSEVSIQIKHLLSQAENHTESIAVGFDYFEYTITRQEFENLIQPFIINTCEKVKDILRNSGLVPSDIDKVLLVGGSSRVPLVRKMVQETLQKDISLDADPELAVCQGAVCLGLIGKENVADKKEGHEKDERFEDKTADNDRQIEAYSNVAGENKNSVEEERIKQEQHVNQVIIPEVYDTDESPGIMKNIMFGVITGHYALDGEWIYYSEKKDGVEALYKIKTDGTHKTMVRKSCSCIGSVIKAEGEWVYYQYGRCFYRVRKNGSGDTRISKELVNVIYTEYVLKDGQIYFSDNTSHLKKLSVDGSNITSIIQLSKGNSAKHMRMEKEWIYFSTSANNRLYRVCMDGSNLTNIYEAKRSIDKIAVYNDWIFYSDYYDDLWKVHVDGTGNCRVIKDAKILYMNIIDGWVYYNNLENHENIYRVRIDGTSKQEVSFETLDQALAVMKKI